MNTFWGYSQVYLMAPKKNAVVLILPSGCRFLRAQEDLFFLGKLLGRESPQCPLRAWSILNTFQVSQIHEGPQDQGFLR